MNEPKYQPGLRYSMKSLMILITLFCVVAALPGGMILLAALTGWMLMVALVVVTLLTFSDSINRILAGSRSLRDEV